ncbi:MAG: T9SS type A sorting domain-containing protein [Bacteroidetes bacterium]|nr:T9SS type A sorting domain-containing protein [Bacteroidota bacterium]
MKNYIIYFLSLIFVIKLNAQPPKKFYSKYGGSGVDIGYGLKQTLDSNYIIIGSSTSYGDNGSDFFLMKIDSMGQFLWQKTFGGFNQDVGKSIALLSDGGFVITGYTSSYGAGGYDVLTIRTDKFGNQLWLKSFGGLDWDFGNDVIIAADGNIVVCGSTYSFGYGNKDGLILKYDLSGNLLWQKYYGGKEDDELVAVTQSTNGLNYLAGNTKSLGDTKGDAWLFAVNMSGDSITSANVGKPNKEDKSYDMVINPLNELIICGSVDTSSTNLHTNNCIASKRNTNGGLISEVIYSGAGNDDKYLSVAKQHSGTDLMFSRSVYKPGFSIEAQPLLADLNMNWVNSTTYVSTQMDEAYEVISTYDNGYAMVGYTKGYSGNLSEDILFIKIDNGLVGATSIVGIHENSKNVSIYNPYYLDNKIIFNNTNFDKVNYTISNQIGQIIQSGSTQLNEVNLNLQLTPGIYLITLNNYTSKIIVTE